jgi:hypothetical protein
MPMSYFDFDQEATVTWADKPVLGDMHGGPGNVRPFETLREALNFVSGLAPHLRKTAFVMTVTTNYNGEEIDELMEKLAAAPPK